MTDLGCIECGWAKACFDEDNEIEEYIQATELLPAHFADQECPRCGQESLEVFHTLCRVCQKPEPDCVCEIEELNLSEEEKENLRDKVMELLREKEEEIDMSEEKDIHSFKQKDLSMMAEKLIGKSFGRT